MQNLEATIKSIIENELLDEYLFLVRLNIQQQGKMEIKIALDGDHGVTIEQCATISRKLGHIIEEQELIEVPYILQVSSAGVGEPLIKRQYQNNIDRFLEVKRTDSEKPVLGKLVDVTEDAIQILEEIPKKGKNKSQKMTLATEATQIPFEQIQRAVVKIIF